MCSGKCSGICGVCKAITGIVLILVTFVTAAAAIGVWHSHVIATGWIFGTAEASLSLLVFLASLMVWLKLFRKMCPCGRMGCGGGCPCGKENCSCGKGGMTCPMCKHTPCTCNK